MNNEYKNLISGELINNEKFSELKGNAMLLHRTDLWIEWDFVNNKNLDIYNVTKGSDKKAWWKCSKCGENYNSVIHSRVKGVNCPYCRGLKPSPKYNLSTINPTLSLEWSNINTKPPTEYTPSSGKIVWWLGKCGHEFKARIADRSSGKGCPYCVHNGKVLLGFNDITTTHPHIVEFFNEKSEACKYTKGSSKKIKFKCHCGNIMTKRISDVIKRGLNCPVCSDGISFGEKILYNLLKEYNIEFKYDSKLEWSGNKRYDFILTDYCNSIIEIHGEQHSKISTGNFKVTNLDKQIENDKFKKQLAIDNGVIDYFEIHIHNKDINQLIDNLENTGLLDFLNLKDIDWSDLVIKSHKSIVIDVCSYYSKNRKSTCEISEIYKLSIQTIIKYLKLGNDIGLCEYSPSSVKSKMITRIKKSKSVNQYNLKGEYLNTFTSIPDALDYMNVRRNSGISRCCRGLARSYNGYLWRYSDEVIKGDNIASYKRSDTVSVVKLTLTGDLIEIFDTVKLAELSVNGTVNIAKCCNGDYEQSKGYKWMYLEDYIKLRS